jgi:hypothetical protein
MIAHDDFLIFKKEMNANAKTDAHIILFIIEKYS